MAQCNGPVVVYLKEGNSYKPLCTGTLANGGCLGTDKPINPASGDVFFVRLQNAGPDTPYFKVTSFSPQNGKCGSNGHKHHYQLSLKKV